MTRKYEWLERQRRMVRCKVHGLHYDPELTRGCVLCQKEAGKRAPRRPPQLLVVLLCLMGIAIVLYQIFGRKPSGGMEILTASAGEAESAETVAGVRVDPAPYRQVIEVLENALFERPADGAADLSAIAADVATSGRNLSDALRESGADAAAAAVAELVRRAAESGDDFRDLERLRTDWLRLRRRHLGSAPWFVEPAAEGSADERAMVAEYRSIADELVALIQEAAAESAALGEGTGEEDPEARWREYASDFRGRLLDLRRRFPPRRASRDSGSQVLLAIQYLEQALERARGLTAGARPRPGPGGGFEEVLAVAERARQAFSEVRL
jgi:hypothetical protein